MSNVVEIQRADDPRDVIHEAVQLLAEGELIGFPTDTVYVAAALALSTRGVERLVALQHALEVGVAYLALKGAPEAFDYVPGMSALGNKLVRRCWPGPVVLVFSPASDRGLAASLPEPTRRLLAEAGGMALRVPAHDVITAVLRLSPAPLVFAGEAARGRVGFKTAHELADAVGERLAMVIDAGPCRYGQPSAIVRVTGERWDLVQEGVVTHRTLSRLAGSVYLFVCTGNTCRSPMAEGLFRKMLAERLKCSEEDLVDHGFVVASAGLAAAVGSPPSPESVRILQDRGVDLQGHSSQPATPRLLNQADHIFTMTKQHRDAILREFPEMASRVDVLARDGSDVSDPIGSGIEEYTKCAEEIERHLYQILSELSVS